MPFLQNERRRGQLSIFAAKSESVSSPRFQSLPTRPRFWGATLSSGTPSFSGAVGERTDAETGLIYMRQRWYDADLGLWLTPDPIGFSGGLNLYAYVENQPVGAVDPSGLTISCEGDGASQIGYLVDALSRTAGTPTGGKLIRQLSAAKEHNFNMRPSPKPMSPERPAWLRIAPSDLPKGRLRPGSYDIDLDFNSLPTGEWLRTLEPRWAIVPHELAHAHEALYQPGDFLAYYDDKRACRYKFRVRKGPNKGRIVGTNLEQREGVVKHRWEFPILIEAGYGHVPQPLP